MFFTFSQNNSGGRWHIDDDRGISEVVVIEADDAKEAIYLAERIGLYFDGNGDCSCCGNRWSDYDVTGHDLPTLYGEKLNIDRTPIINSTKFSDKNGWVHFKDKTKLKFGIPGSW